MFRSLFTLLIVTLFITSGCVNEVDESLRVENLELKVKILELESEVATWEHNYTNLYTHYDKLASDYEFLDYDLMRCEGISQTLRNDLGFRTNERDDCHRVLSVEMRNFDFAMATEREVQNQMRALIRAMIDCSSNVSFVELECFSYRDTNETVCFEESSTNLFHVRLACQQL